MYCKGIAFEPQKLVNENYRDVLHTDLLNLGFHKTKKNECNYCFKIH